MDAMWYSVYPEENIVESQPSGPTLILMGDVGDPGGGTAVTEAEQPDFLAGSWVEPDFYDPVAWEDDGLCDPEAAALWLDEYELGAMLA